MLFHAKSQPKKCKSQENEFLAYIFQKLSLHQQQVHLRRNSRFKMTKGKMFH